MKFNLKKLMALLLAAILMLSLTGLGEGDIVIEDSATVDGIIPDDIPTLDDVELDGQLDILESLTLDPGPQAPEKAKEAAEAITEDQAYSNALVKKVSIGIKEKYTIDTSSLSGKLTYVTADKKIATVNKKGVIVGKKVGSTRITITDGQGKKYKITVTVAKAPNKVTLNADEATLEIGNTVQLVAKLPNKTASNKLTWKSSNQRVATVSDKGKVEAIAAGTTTITVKTFNGKKATCKVTVKGDEEEEPITASSYNITIQAGETRTIKITYLNDNDLVWQVENTNIVSCQWGEGWDGDTCDLYITGLNQGSTNVRVYDETTHDSISIHVAVSGQTTKITELSQLLFKTVSEANAALDVTLTHNEDNIYSCDYFSVAVDSSGVIHLVGFFNNFGSYTLMGQWPGRNLTNAANELFDTGWKLESDESQMGTFSHPELPGCKLYLKYANSKVDYIIITW